MRLLHTTGFNDHERLRYKLVIYENLVASTLKIIDALNRHRIPFTNDVKVQSTSFLALNDGDTKSLTALTAEAAAKDLLDGKYPYTNTHKDLPRSLYVALRLISGDAAVQTVLDKYYSYGITDNIVYFYRNLERIFATSYVPTNSDILHARAPTSGIHETIFEPTKSTNHMTYRMIDVGGQRSERRKWIHSFEGVDLLLFIANAAGYNQIIEEDNSTNQMEEAFMIYRQIINSHWFSGKPVIIFLNKMDLLRTNLNRDSFTAAFPSFEQFALKSSKKRLIDQILAFYTKRFLDISPSRDAVYVHETTAIDTELIKKTMMSVDDIIIQQSLQKLLM
ncbi:hypothetical protein CANCADRAFT_32687 [Tortispora caseinolytica NRRL Y-17796]|uniref:Uncharacterized protein n=1 Tax=Tortispora caseinolytica NRRL Y-17796 TaxID=767744 RepID=A0A1E4TCC6_9ASCO|nr:hypothetical protein CANCADRAFT_32687 [Tortispora caseinolytica NRRL Y-17796]